MDGGIKGMEQHSLDYSEGLQHAVIDLKLGMGEISFLGQVPSLLQALLRSQRHSQPKDTRNRQHPQASL